MGDEQHKVIYPHTARDLRRSGITIGSVGLVFLPIGYRFYIGTDPADQNAAFMIWVVGIGLITIGALIFATRKRKGAPEGSAPIA
jgi:cytochrome c biogenesis protein CcdA